MNTTVLISSSDGIHLSKSHHFIIHLNPELAFDENKKCYVALDSVDMTYSWYNAASKYNNNNLTYSPT